MARESRFRACPLCEAICGLEFQFEAQRLVAIRGDDDDPFSRGHICPKGNAILDLESDPDRLKRPLLRQGDALERNRLGRGIRARRRAARGRAARARRQRGRRIPRQSERASLRPHRLPAAAAARAENAERVFRFVGRPVAAPARLRADVRPSVPAADSGCRPHRLFPDARRQSDWRRWAA